MKLKIFLLLVICLININLAYGYNITGCKNCAKYQTLVDGRIWKDELMCMCKNDEGVSLYAILLDPDSCTNILNCNGKLKCDKC